MGVYLHPTLKDPDHPEILENLACVPPGTSAALAHLEASYPQRGESDSTDENAFYESLFACPHLDRLHNFMLFGWGKTKRAFDAIAIKYGFDTTVGSAALAGNHELVSELLLAQGLRPDEILQHISGLCWG